MKSRGPRIVSFVLAILAAVVIISISFPAATLKDTTALMGLN